MKSTTNALQKSIQIRTLTYASTRTLEGQYIKSWSRAYVFLGKFVGFVVVAGQPN